MAVKVKHTYSEEGLKKLTALQDRLINERRMRGESQRDVSNRIKAPRDFVIVAETVGTLLLSATQRWARAYDLKLILEHDHPMVMSVDLLYHKERAYSFDDDEWTRAWAMKSLGAVRRQLDIPGKIVDKRLGFERATSSTSVAWESKTLDPSVVRYFAQAEAIPVNVDFKVFTREEWKNYA